MQPGTTQGQPGTKQGQPGTRQGQPGTKQGQPLQKRNSQGQKMGQGHNWTHAHILYFSDINISVCKMNLKS